MQDRISRAVRYRNKGEEVRVIAETLKDPAARAMLLTVAQDYALWADMLERQDRSDADVAAPSRP